MQKFSQFTPQLFLGSIMLIYLSTEWMSLAKTNWQKPTNGALYA